MTAELVEVVHQRVLCALSDSAAALDFDEQVARDLVRAEAPLLGSADVASVVQAVRARVEGLGPLEALLADEAVTEVMINGAGPVWVERHGVLDASGVVVDEPTVLRLVERIVAPLGLRVDRSSPMVDARLPDGSRVNAILRPLAVDGPCLTMRRFGARSVPLAAFADVEVAGLLAEAVSERRNTVVSGATGAGKTTLLNALAAVIPAGERVITIEDAAELRLPGNHVVRLEARPSNADGVGAVTIRDLVRNALRMRPDRIVVGEVRGAEALDMLQAMNTGHEGALATCHANSPEDALRRIETLSLLAGVELPLSALREQIASAVDLVVQVDRGRGGRRVVRSIGEPFPDGERVRCRPVVSEGRVVAAPTRPGRSAGLRS